MAACSCKCHQSGPTPPQPGAALFLLRSTVQLVTTSSRAGDESQADFDCSVHDMYFVGCREGKDRHLRVWRHRKHGLRWWVKDHRLLLPLGHSWGENGPLSQGLFRKRLVRSTLNSNNFENRAQRSERLQGLRAKCPTQFDVD